MSNSPFLGRGRSGFLPTDIWKTAQSGSGYDSSIDNTPMAIKSLMDLYCKIKTVDLVLSLSYSNFTSLTFDPTVSPNFDNTTYTGNYSGSGSGLAGLYPSGKLTNAALSQPRRRSVGAYWAALFNVATMTIAGTIVEVTNFGTTTTPFSHTPTPPAIPILDLFSNSRVFQNSTSPLSFPAGHLGTVPSDPDTGFPPGVSTANPGSAYTASGGVLVFNFPDGSTYSFPFYIPADSTVVVPGFSTTVKTYSLSGSITVNCHLWD